MKQNNLNISIMKILKMIEELESELEIIESKGFQSEETRKRKKILLKTIKKLKKKERKLLSAIEKRKKKKLKIDYLLEKEDRDERLEEEGLKRIEIDNNLFEIIYRSTRIPYIETYNEDTWQYEGAIFLKNGSRIGLLPKVKIIKEVKIEQDHNANVELFYYNSRFDVINPSTIDKLWDIDITLKYIKCTNIESAIIKIQELGVTDEDNTNSREFELKGETKNFLLVKEYINNFPEANNILNLNDIDLDLNKRIINKEDDIYRIENYDCLYERNNTITFVLVLKNMHERSIRNIKLVKIISNKFENLIIRDTTWGLVELIENKIIWTIDILPPEILAVTKFTSEINLNEIQDKKSGKIKVSYNVNFSNVKEIGIEKININTNYNCFIRTLEGSDDLGIWDCKLVLENNSEFFILIDNIEVYTSNDELIYYNEFNNNKKPLLPAGAQWHSTKWQYKSKKKTRI
ncbi:MAG: hypothetical protein ACFFAN_02170 [Promethearchaeota archaeon]